LFSSTQLEFETTDNTTASVTKPFQPEIVIIQTKSVIAKVVESFEMQKVLNDLEKYIFLFQVPLKLLVTLN
jgi:hypothetical protein